MHPEARHFLSFVASNFETFFNGKTVLDVGSGDINGNNRHLFKDCNYEGNDVTEGPNVTVVSCTKDLAFKEATFDTIVSSECFEHDLQYVQSLHKIVQMLKPGGLFAFTCASTGRAEHGTLRTTPGDSLATLAGVTDFSEYYKNLTAEDVLEAVGAHAFCTYRFYYNARSRDLYFFGIRSGESAVPISFVEYEAAYVHPTATK